MAALQLGDQGALQLIDPLLIMRYINRRNTNNDDELEKRLREYIDSKFKNTSDFKQIKEEIKKDIIANLPTIIKELNFQTKDEMDQYIKSLNYVLRQEYESKMATLVGRMNQFEGMVGRYMNEIGENKAILATHEETLNLHKGRLDNQETTLTKQQEQINSYSSLGEGAVEALEHILDEEDGILKRLKEHDTRLGDHDAKFTLIDETHRRLAKELTKVVSILEGYNRRFDNNDRRLDILEALREHIPKIISIIEKIDSPEEVDQLLNTVADLSKRLGTSNLEDINIDEINTILRSLQEQVANHTDRLDAYKPLGEGALAAANQVLDVINKPEIGILATLDEHTDKLRANENLLKTQGNLIKINGERIDDHMTRLTALEEQITNLGSSGANVDELKLAVKSIKEQIGNANIKELNIRELNETLESLQTQIDTKANKESVERLGQSYQDLNRLYQELIGSYERLDGAYDIIDGKVSALRSDFNNLQYIKPAEFEAYKAEITTKIQTLTESVALITTIQADIDAIRAELTELKQVSSPDVAPKLESAVSELQAQIPTATTENLVNIKDEIKAIKDQFTSELDILKQALLLEIERRAKEISATIPTDEEFAKLLKEFNKISPASIGLLKQTLDELARTRTLIDRLEKTKEINDAALSRGLEQKLSEQLIQFKTDIQAQIDALRASQTKNKYLKGGKPDYGKFEQEIKFHIDMANQQIEQAEENIDNLLKNGLFKPAEEHIDKLEDERESLTSNPIEQNQIEQLILEIVAVRNRLSHELEIGLFTNDILEIKHYAEKNIAKIKNENIQRDQNGKEIIPEDSNIKFKSINLEYKLAPGESNPNKALLAIRNRQIMEITELLQKKYKQLIQDFIIRSISPDNLYSDLNKDLAQIYEKYTQERRTLLGISTKNNFILTETPTF